MANTGTWQVRKHYTATAGRRWARVSDDSEGVERLNLHMGHNRGKPLAVEMPSRFYHACLPQFTLPRHRKGLGDLFAVLRN